MYLCMCISAVFVAGITLCNQSSANTFASKDVQSHTYTSHMFTGHCGQCLPSTHGSYQWSYACRAGYPANRKHTLTVSVVSAAFDLIAGESCVVDQRASVSSLVSLFVSYCVF